MKQAQYQTIHDYISARPKLTKAVSLSVKVFTGAVYLAYPLMLLYLLVFSRDDLPKAVLVPLAGFLLCTVLRAKINAPRPYEAMGIPSITPKDTKGKSFPSRHAACASVIAFTAIFVLPPLGIVLLILSVLIPLTRVFAGVHYVKDVLAGWLLGAVIGLAGMLLL